MVGASTVMVLHCAMGVSIHTNMPCLCSKHLQSLSSSQHERGTGCSGINCAERVQFTLPK